MALNSLFCADVPLSNYSLTHLYVDESDAGSGDKKDKPLSLCDVCSVVNGNGNSWADRVRGVQPGGSATPVVNKLSDEVAVANARQAVQSESSANVPSQPSELQSVTPAQGKLFYTISQFVFCVRQPGLGDCGCPVGDGLSTT